MFDYIEKLRQKPEKARRKAVFLISLSITLIIALVWGTFLAMKISSTDFSFVDTSPEKNIPSLSQSFSNFFDQVGAIFSNTQKAVESISTTTTEIASSSDVVASTTVE